MQAFEIETHIDQHGQIQLPAELFAAYGKLVRLVILLPEAAATPRPTTHG